jgi:hypothetical protein
MERMKVGTLLKTCFWIGAILDALTLAPMLSPQIGGKMFGIDNFHPGADYRYAMNIGAVLMMGWTALLIWAARSPTERKGVLLLTILVIFGLMSSGAFAVSARLIAPEKMIPLWVLQAALISFFGYVYLRAAATKGGD